MAAAAERVSTDRQATAQDARNLRCQKRKSKKRAVAKFRTMFLMIAGVAAVGMVLGWMSIYARMTVTGYNRSRLIAQCKQEQLKNQTLKLKCESLCSPHNVVAAAQKCGMVYATQYDYISKSQTVASAAGQAGD